MRMDISRDRTVEAGEGVLRHLGARLHAAAPSPHVVLFGSVVWGVLMALSAALAIWMHNSLIVASPLALTALYFYGGSLAFAPGLWLSAVLFDRRGMAWRLIGGTTVILLVTHTATAGIFALQYRVFYSHWHSSFPSVTWFFQFSFTSAGAIYQYSVDSIYYYWPFTLLCFLGFGLWFARRKRPLAH